jgi:GrpB-like predicted nucleotidyltransferase (UPF0157 family)
MGTPVEIVDYDPEWPRIFARFRDKIASSLGSLATRIEHVGSTAVPGLAAKPVIDLDVVISCWADLPAVISNLRPLGYHPQGDLGVPGREAFTSPSGEPSHHLYVCADDSPQLARHLIFRDTLRAQPDTVRAYADLKRSLAEKFGGDRTAYADAKTAFVKRVLATAAHSERGMSEVGKSSHAVASLKDQER